MLWRINKKFANKPQHIPCVPRWVISRRDMHHCRTECYRSNNSDGHRPHGTPVLKREFVSYLYNHVFAPWVMSDNAQIIKWFWTVHNHAWPNPVNFEQQRVLITIPSLNLTHSWQNWVLEQILTSFHVINLSKTHIMHNFSYISTYRIVSSRGDWVWVPKIMWGGGDKIAYLTEFSNLLHQTHSNEGVVIPFVACQQNEQFYR